MNIKKYKEKLAPLSFALLLIPFTALLVIETSGCTSQQIEPNEPLPQDNGEAMRLATFAGGCFWCVESAFEEIPGVASAVSGYTGGPELDPTYQQVASGHTGHVEAVQITFDSTVLTYEDLLWVFWRQIDPTDDGGQFVDRGTQYRTAIFVHSAQQRSQAEASRTEMSQSGRYSEPIVTEIRDASVFYAAEDYHQDFYLLNPDRYYSYRRGSGRDSYLERIWGDEPHGSHAWQERVEAEFVKPTDEELRERLTDRQYNVTQQDGTEPPFNNEYWDHHEEGIYVDIVSGEPLFSSTHKYESGTGWPSFFTPLIEDNIVEVEDRSGGMVRTEVRSRLADSHLGHLFRDGPQPTGLRYCINSASLRFIPASNLESEGYRWFEHLFAD